MVSSEIRAVEGRCRRFSSPSILYFKTIGSERGVIETTGFERQTILVATLLLIATSCGTRPNPIWDSGADADGDGDGDADGDEGDPCDGDHHCNQGDCSDAFICES